MLYNTKVELEQIIDPDMYLFCEPLIRGGISAIAYRRAKVNNKYMIEYDVKTESSYIMYYDANTLYGGVLYLKFYFTVAASKVRRSLLTETCWSSQVI
jgi:hypothetical protein